MKAYTYLITKSNLPIRHSRYSRGYAYETESHFIHFDAASEEQRYFVYDSAVIQSKSGSLLDWITNSFGASEIKLLAHEPGHTTKGIWRPCLFHIEDTSQALGFTESEMRFEQQSLRLILEKLDEIFLYIAPTAKCMDTYSHRTRELLMLACTELEGTWKYFLQVANYNKSNKYYSTKDFVKLKEKLFLKEYQITLISNESPISFQPFMEWNSNSPTDSISWYAAYNQVKHNRKVHFDQATLKHCLNAVAANLIMYCVRFGLCSIDEEANMFSSMVRQHFRIDLLNPDLTSFYIYNLSPRTGGGLHTASPRAYGMVTPFCTNPLTLI